MESPIASYGATPGILTEDVSRAWGERVKQWRDTRGISADQLATLLHVSKGTINGWENGGRAPKDEGEYTERFRQLQAQVGESPGFDSPSRVTWLWRTHFRGKR